MAETPENESKTPELTRPVDFIVPNQDLIERVIDARLAAHADHEKDEKKTTSSRTRTSSASKDDDKS